MVTTHRDLQYTLASEAELDTMLTGHAPGRALDLRHQPQLQFLDANMTGVVWVVQDREGKVIQPLVLVCRDDDLRRLCSRYAQLRSELSPLSAWCHLVTPTFFQSIDSVWREADLGDAQAAWTGVIIAEAILAGDRALPKIRVQTCLSTQTFAIARSRSLWTQLDTADVLKRFDTINRICRNPIGRQERLRSSLLPIWDCLAGLSSKEPVSQQGLLPIVEAMCKLRDARYAGRRDEARVLSSALAQVVPEADQFASLEEQPPETRLRLFDRLVGMLELVSKDDTPANQLRRHALAFLTGYLSTVAAGGSPSLGLVSNAVHRYPELLAWAYLAGSIGERVAWTSGFDGLGRLVSRETMRPLRLDEPPTCDFALDEARAVVDNQLSDPLVRLRVKQAGFATVSLFPGVNVAVPIETTAQDAPRQETRANVQTDRTDLPSHGDRQPSVITSADRAIGAFLDAFRPYLQREIRRVLRETEDERDRGRYKKPKKPSGPQLPLPKK